MMDKKIINGNELAKQKQVQIQKRLAKLGRPPKVVSFLIGDDKPSLVYSNLKRKKALELGIEFEIFQLPSNVTFSYLSDQIIKLNNDSFIDGVMIQLPVPEEVLQGHQVFDLIKLINSHKDVDGMLGTGQLLPATIKGVFYILDYLNINYHSNVFGIVGSKGQIGSCLEQQLKIKDAQVIGIDIKNPHSSISEILFADVVISAVGVTNLIKIENIKQDAILIDIGLGDFDPLCYKKALKYTPVSGGVGPMTVISLMDNAVELLELK